MSRLKNEWRMVRELYRFARRHRRYLTIALALYCAELKLGRRAYTSRLGFVFLQVIDDWLDGDRPCPREPYDVVRELLRRAESRRFDRTQPIDCLGEALFNELERGPASEEGIEKTLKVIRLMLVDRQRVIRSEIWSREQIQNHHRATFGMSLDLTLIAQRSALRTSDAPRILDLFGWCSTMRDLEEDLDKGLCNVPAHVVSQIDNDPMSSSWSRNAAVLDWIEDSHDDAAQLIQGLSTDLKRLDGQAGAGLFRLFHRSMTSFHQKQMEVRSRSRTSLDRPL